MGVSSRTTMYLIKGTARGGGMDKDRVVRGEQDR